MLVRIVAVVLVLGGLVVGALYLLGSGRLGRHWDAGVPTAAPIPAEVVGARASAQRASAEAVGVEAPKQVLFGDLHVHSTFSTDAFMMSLPMMGGDGARPVSDACDFARYCSALDFWSINDHALAITPRRWSETVHAMRQCDAVAGDAGSPDVVPFLGWEWTQVGTTPGNHYGHKNVIFRGLDDADIPTRPIYAGYPAGADRSQLPGPVVLGLFPAFQPSRASVDFVRYFRDMVGVPQCPAGVPERELPADCQEAALTPDQLFEKLDDWALDSIVIPHGTTWGYYTPQGSSWDKQLAPDMHDPERQTLVEVYSGHGNSEEFRPWSSVEFGPDAGRSCPEPTQGYLPSCWRAGEIIRERCRAAGEGAEECERRAVEARSLYLEADVSGHLTVPGSEPEDWKDSGQCRDCFLPSFNYRPRSSVQYMMALSNFEEDPPLRFRFGFMASSDVHSARPGTGYKEFLRREMTEARFGAFRDSPLGGRLGGDEPLPESRSFERSRAPAQFFGLLETERQASFFLTGGLVAAHAAGRDRDAVWSALDRREVYGTSGPRILLWFDLLDEDGSRTPMGSEVRLAETPRFEVRALGAFVQKPGCPDYASAALSPDRLERLCGGECYHPSDTRHRIARIEVVRIRPQSVPGEPIADLIEDPWRTLECEDGPAGCRVGFEDAEFTDAARDTVYYVRAIQEPTDAVAHDGVACLGTPLDDDCLGATKERAWSSPIFVNFQSGAPSMAQR